MHVLRTRLIQQLQRADRHGRFRVYYPHVPGPRRRLLPRRAFQADDRRRRVAAHRLVQPLQPLDGRRHRVRRGGRGARRAARARRRSATSASGCSPSTSARSRRACATRSSAPAACTAPIAAFGDQRAHAAPARGTAGVVGDACVSVAAVADPEEPIALEILLASASRRGGRAERDARLGQARAVIARASSALMALWRFTPLADIVTAEERDRMGEGLRRAAGGRRWSLMARVHARPAWCMFPRPLITLAAVIAFGPWLGFLYSLTGICSSAAVTWSMGTAHAARHGAAPRRREARPHGRGAEESTACSR